MLAKQLKMKHEKYKSGRVVTGGDGVIQVSEGVIRAVLPRSLTNFEI